MSVRADIALPALPDVLRARVSLLGTFCVTIGDEPLAVAPGVQRLVALLAIKARPLHRSCVAGCLWPEAPEERAAANLRSAIWRLPKEAVYVVGVSPTHLWLDARVRVDAHEMAALAERLIGRRESVDAAAVNHATFESDLLPDWHDEWTMLERERLRQLRLHALEALSGHLVARGRFPQAIQAALAAIDSEPLRESAHRALICAHLAEGNRSEAIRHYRLIARLLQEELGVAPSAHMSALFD